MKIHPAHFQRKLHRLHAPTLAVCLLLSAFMCLLLGQKLWEDTVSQAQVKADAGTVSLVQVLTQASNATGVLSAVVYSEQFQVGDFDELGSTAMNMSTVIRCVELAPEGTVQYVYPDYNDDEIGVSLMEGRIWKSVTGRSRYTGLELSVGPFDWHGRTVIALVQPVYRDSSDLSSFWGFAVVIVDVERTVEAAGITELDDYPCRYLLETSELGKKSTLLDGGGSSSGSISSARTVYGKTWMLHLTPMWSLQSILTLVGAGILLTVLSILIALLRAQTQKLASQSVTDRLTGILNRRGFDDAAKELMNSQDFRFGMIIAIDINHFKTYNDLYGHANGDALLSSFAQDLKQYVGQDGIVARNGGDEFQILLFNPTGSWKKRLDVYFSRQHSFDYGGKSYPYAISGGYATWPDMSRKLGELCQMADRALYHQKMTGQPGICCYEAQMEQESREQIGFNFKDLANGLPGAVVICSADEQGRILYASEQSARMLGYESAEEFVRAEEGALFTHSGPEERRVIQEKIDEQAKDGSGSREFRVRCRVNDKSGAAHDILETGKIIGHDYYGQLCFLLMMDGSQEDAGQAEQPDAQKETDPAETELPDAQKETDPGEAQQPAGPAGGGAEMEDT